MTHSSAAVVNHSDQGPHYWVLTDSLRLILTGEQTGGRYAMAETIVPPGEGPPPHRHNREDELFYILEGDFSFTLANARLRGGPGTVAFLPRGIIHQFKNLSDKPGRFILMATPAGFDAFVPDAGKICLDRTCVPTIGEADIQKLMAACALHELEVFPQHLPTKDGPAFGTGSEHWVLGVHVNIRLTSAESGGAFTLAEVTCEPGAGVPPHSHKVEDEIFYVMRGTFTFTVEGKDISAPVGTTVRVPKGTMHGFINTGVGPATLIDYHTPGGFEKFFEECGVPCTDRTKGPPGTPPDMKHVMAMIEKHGMVMPL